MTKEKYKSKICPSCVNYSYKKQGESCGKFVQVDGIIACKNYHKWKECMKKSCRACGMCKE